MENDAIEVASDQIAYYNAYVHSQYLKEMSLPESYRDAEIIEGISDTVGKAADDEKRYCKKQREIVLLARKSYRCGHHESATDSQKAAVQSAGPEPEFKEFLCSSLYIHRRHSGDEGDDKTTGDITGKNQRQLPEFILSYKASRSCIQSKFIAYYSKQSEREKYGSEQRAIRFTLYT